MKNIWKVISIAFAALIAGCFDDKGNYDYLPEDVAMPVQIEELKDTAIQASEVLKIQPTINGMEDESRYNFLWYAAKAVAAGQAPVRDTLAQTRDLDVKISLTPELYNLVYIIEDKETGVYSRTQIKLTVTTPFAAGWYILKDENEKTDFDYIDTKGNVLENVIQWTGREPLQGKAKKMIYQSSGYYHQIENPDGTMTTLANQKEVHVLSEKDMNILNANDMSVFKTYEEAFYEAPVVCKPQTCFNVSRDLYVINNGKIHAIYGMSSNIGKYPYEKAGDYELSDDLLGNVYGVMVWDKKSRSFFHVTSSGNTLNDFENKDGEVALKNMNYEMISGLLRNDGVYTTAYFVMKKMDTDEYYLADVAYNQTTYPFNSFEKIPDGYAMPKAKVIAAHNISSGIYFAKGSELWLYHVANVEEKEVKLLDFQGEEIQLITQTNVINNFNHLVVVTNLNGKYKLYRFNFIGSTVEIDTTPVGEPYTGSGNVRDIVYRR